MSDEMADWPRARCPRCGGGHVLTPAVVLAELLDTPQPAATPYGWPGVLSVGGAAVATCNASGCGWIGTVDDVHAAQGLPRP